MKSFEIPQNEIDTLEDLQSLLNFNEIESQEEGYMDSEDEYPFPHIFKFQALAIRTLLAHPEHKFSPIKNLKHIFSEEIDEDATPKLYTAIFENEEEFGEPEITLDLPNYYTKFYFIKINNKSAIYYQGCDGNSSSNFSFFGVII